MARSVPAPLKNTQVLRSRSLPIPEVLSLLADRTDDVRWQYLHHLVYGGLQAMALSSSSTNNSSSSTNNNNNSSSGRGHQGGVGTVSVGSLNESPADCEGGDCGVGAVGGEDVRELHTELALELVECVLAAQVRSGTAGCRKKSRSQVVTARAFKISHSLHVLCAYRFLIPACRPPVYAPSRQAAAARHGLSHNVSVQAFSNTHATFSAQTPDTTYHASHVSPVAFGISCR